MIRKEKDGWKISYTREKPATPLLDTINYPIHMKNLSLQVSHAWIHLEATQVFFTLGILFMSDLLQTVAPVISYVVSSINL